MTFHGFTMKMYASSLLLDENVRFCGIRAQGTEVELPEVRVEVQRLHELRRDARLQARVRHVHVLEGELRDLGVVLVHPVHLEDVECVEASRQRAQKRREDSSARAVLRSVPLLSTSARLPEAESTQLQGRGIANPPQVQSLPTKWPTVFGRRALIELLRVDVVRWVMPTAFFFPFLRLMRWRVDHLKPSAHSAVPRVLGAQRRVLPADHEEHPVPLHRDARALLELLRVHVRGDLTEWRFRNPRRGC